MSKAFFDFSKFQIVDPTLHIEFDKGNENQETIVLLHGLAATSATWDPIQHEIDHSKYRVVAIDLLGFGQSPIPEGASYTVEEHAKYVRRTIKKLNVLTPFKLVGHSMGSLVAANYSYQWPNDVHEAYYVGMPLYIHDDGALSKRSRWRTSLIFRFYNFFRNKRGLTMRSSQWLRKILGLRDGMEVNDTNWNAFRLSLEETVQKQHTYDEIANSAVPVHMIYGTHDEFMVKGAMKKVVELPHVQEHVVHGADHKLTGKLLEEVARVIQSS